MHSKSQSFKFPGQKEYLLHSLLIWLAILNDLSLDICNILIVLASQILISIFKELLLFFCERSGEGEDRSRTDNYWAIFLEKASLPKN
jgi:hypothetical protein